MRICFTCKQSKTLNEFSVAKDKPLGRRYQCRACCNAYNKNYYESLPGGRKQQRVKASQLRREKLAGVPKPESCNICGSMARIVFDHDHATGKFRGWLCNECNAILGYSRENPITLRKLAEYLEGKK